MLADMGAGNSFARRSASARFRCDGVFSNAMSAQCLCGRVEPKTSHFRPDPYPSGIGEALDALAGRDQRRQAGQLHEPRGVFGHGTRIDGNAVQHHAPGRESEMPG